MLPDWMRIVVLCNPTTYLIDMVRALAFGADHTLSPWVSLGVLVRFGVVGVGLALLSFQASLRKQ
jgi:ABC-type polysaccharide/polyol phosphate export permease